MNKQLKKELKRLLSGRTILDNEGVLMALPEGQRMIFHGLTNGWSSVLFSGIAVQEYCFQLASDGAEAFSVVFPVMQRLGRLVVLSERETALAVAVYGKGAAGTVSAAPRSERLLPCAAGGIGQSRGGCREEA